MGMNVNKTTAYNADINVTPLVDVVLVLLIIFMVIVPLAQMGYDIDIPKEAVVDQPPQDIVKQVVLAINQDGCPLTPEDAALPDLPAGCSVYVNQEAVAVADLSSRMTDVYKNRAADDKILFLAAEEQLSYALVVRIVDLAKSGAGETVKIAIVTDEKLARPSPVDLAAGVPTPVGG